jgi:hypothetical protein
MWKWIEKRQTTIIIYVAIAIALFVGVHWYGNWQRALGEAQGRQYVTDQLIKEKEKEWTEREKEIAAARADIADKINILNRATERMLAERAEMEMSVDTELERIRNEREKGYQSAAAVPDNRVWTDIRAVSGQLSGTD